MGIANDSISSIHAGFTYTTPSSDPNCAGVPWGVWLFGDGNFGGPSTSIQSGFFSSYFHVQRRDVVDCDAVYLQHSMRTPRRRSPVRDA